MHVSVNFELAQISISARADLENGGVYHFMDVVKVMRTDLDEDQHDTDCNW